MKKSQSHFREANLKHFIGRKLSHLNHTLVFPAEFLSSISDILSYMWRNRHNQNHEASLYTLTPLPRKSFPWLVRLEEQTNCTAEALSHQTLEASCPYRAHVSSALRSGSTNRSIALLLFSVSLVSKLFLWLCSKMVVFLRGPENTLLHILTLNQLRNMKNKENNTSTLFLIKVIL